MTDLSMTKILEAVQPALARKGEHVVPNTTGPSFSPNSQDLRMDLSGIRLVVSRSLSFWDFSAVLLPESFGDAVAWASGG